MGSAKIKVSAVILVPVDPDDVPNNSIYSDIGNSNALSNKTSGGTEQAVGAVSSSDAFSKMAKNVSGSSIAANLPVSRASDGSIVLADSDAAQGQRPIGVTMEEIPHDSFGLIGLIGRNLPGALSTFSFVPGADLYIPEDGTGYTADPESFTNSDDSLILIGVADCADGDMSGDAPDLILLRQILVRP